MKGTYRNYLICLLPLLFAAAGCEPETAAKRYTSAVKAGKTYVVDPVQQGYEQTVAPVLTKPLEDLAEIKKTTEETREIIGEVREGARAAKETARSAKQRVSSTAGAVRSTVRSYARAMPRSQQEANQLVEQKGRGFFEWMRQRMQAFVGRHQRQSTRKNEGRKLKK